MHRRFLVLPAAVALLLVASSARAEGRSAAEIAANPALDFVGQLESYRPAERVSGRISVWGHGSFKRDFMGNLVKSWINEFRRHQPDVEFDYRMYGTASAIGALYTGAGNLAILGEEISPAAARAFRRAKGYAPTSVEIATGSLETNFYDYAHMVFVHGDNPLRRLSLDQLRAIFGADKTRIRRWGELGLAGAWADKTIQPYGWQTHVDFALFFRERVLADSHRWNPAIVEFAHGVRPDGTQYDHGQRIVDALAADRYGIAISNLRYATPEVRALSLSWKDKGVYAAPSEANLISRAYPLTRIIPAFVDQPPGTPMEPALREFLRFILSREGQRGLLEHSGYLPLGRAFIEREKAKLR